MIYGMPLFLFHSASISGRRIRKYIKKSIYHTLVVLYKLYYLYLLDSITFFKSSFQNFKINMKCHNFRFHLASSTAGRIRNNIKNIYHTLVVPCKLYYLYVLDFIAFLKVFFSERNLYSISFLYPTEFTHYMLHILYIR